MVRGKGNGGADGLGRALIRQHNKLAAEAKEKGRSLASQRRRAAPLESVIDVSDIDVVLEQADAAERFYAQSSADEDFVVRVDGGSSGGGWVNEEERRRVRQQEEALQAGNLRVPRRPPWTAQMSVEELDANERRAFLEWRRNLARLEENEKLVLTPFEKNLDVWRQLWRVIERSDLLVMVVDARNPLFYRCPDLEEYVREIDEHKKTLLLVNKADLLPANIRKSWAEYFRQHDILHVFWSAKAASAIIEGKPLSGFSAESSSGDPDPDTKIYGRDELLVRLQKEAEAIVEERRASDTTENRDDDGSSDSASVVAAKHVVVGFVGYPNVGKSSTINALLGAKKTGVTSTPGKTKHFQTLIISEELMLCDCPGLVFPSFSSSRHEMVACGVLPIDRMTQHREAVQEVANRVPRAVLEQIYHITLPKPKPYEPASRPPLASELMRAYCTSRGHVSSAGLPDETRAARHILKDYIDGKLPHFELPPDSASGDVDGEEVEEAELAAIDDAGESEEYESDSGELVDASEVVKPGDPTVDALLNEMRDFELANGPSKKAAAASAAAAAKKKATAASYKHHKKPQRKKDRSWRATNGDVDSDGMPIVRVFQKPAVNFAALGVGQQ